MQTTRILTLACLTLIISVTIISASSFAEGPNDRDAIAGVTSGKALFDINLAQAKQVPLYLQVIGLTHQDLVKQGVTPDFVVAFRGPAVQFITGKASAKDSEQTAVYKQIADRVKELKKLGVK